MGLDAMQPERVIQPPPIKRRKINVELDLLGEVTTTLYSLLGLQDAMDMDGLGQVAQ